MNTSKTASPKNNGLQCAPCQEPFSENLDPNEMRVRNRDAVNLAREFGFNNDFKRFSEQDIALIDRLAAIQESELFEFAWKEVVEREDVSGFYEAVNKAVKPNALPGDLCFSDSAQQIQSRVDRDVAEKIGWLQGLISKRKLLLGQKRGNRH